MSRNPRDILALTLDLIRRIDINRQLIAAGRGLTRMDEMATHEIVYRWERLSH